jgi:3-hydroxyisobutyrate dehydrogenase
VTSTAIGFVGLGNMGGRITRVLVDAGQPVLGYDLAAGRVRAAGAEPAESPSAVAAGTDLVLLSLPDSTVVERVVLGGGGLIDALRAGQVVVDLSTASPDSTRRISDRLAEFGVAYLDAGISGGAAVAEKGALTLMVGGPPSALETARPVLEVISARIFHCGDSGAGHTTKLLNNFLNAVSLAATAEVMVARSSRATTSRAG